MSDIDRRMLDTMLTDEHWMRRALGYAKLDPALPFGCVIVDLDDCIRASSWSSGTPTDCTAHSEIKAIRIVQRHLPGDLTGMTVYSTHEPCTMCAGALVHAKPDRVVFGSSRDDVPSWFRPRSITAEAILRDCSRPIEVVGGVLKDDCIALFETVEARIDAAKAGA